MIIYGVDPGPEKSAIVKLNLGRQRNTVWHLRSKYDNNNNLFEYIAYTDFSFLAIEIPFMGGCYLPKDPKKKFRITQNLLQTSEIIGRMIQKFVQDAYISSCGYKKELKQVIQIYSKDWRYWLCGRPGANDTMVNNALWDKFGGRSRAKGTKKNPGLLYDFNNQHLRDALGIALYGKYLIDNKEVTWQEKIE